MVIGLLRQLPVIHQPYRVFRSFLLVYMQKPLEASLSLSALYIYIVLYILCSQKREKPNFVTKKMQNVDMF